MEPPKELIRLCKNVEEFCILGEGNVSCSDGEVLWITATGASLATICPDELACVRTSEILYLLDANFQDDVAIRVALDATSANDVKPSTETFMHAVLLQLNGGGYVAHTHPAQTVALCCLQDAEELAEVRLFPDHVVFCGVASAFVPYFNPGLQLAVEVKKSAIAFRDRYGVLPTTIWLQNHGLLAIGSTRAEAEAATHMSEKASRVIFSALSSGHTMTKLSEAAIRHIANWTDEHYRKRQVTAPQE